MKQITNPDAQNLHKFALGMIQYYGDIPAMEFDYTVHQIIAATKQYIDNNPQFSGTINDIKQIRQILSQNHFHLTDWYVYDDPEDEF